MASNLHVNESVFLECEGKLESILLVEPGVVPSTPTTKVVVMLMELNYSVEGLEG